MGAGGFSQIVGGAVQTVTAMDEQDAETRANRQQYMREQRQADAAIQGAIDKGDAESGKQRILGAQLVAKQGLAYANSGVDATTGTAAAVQADTAALAAHDAQTLQINAAREAWGIREARKQSGQEYGNRQGNINRKATGQILGGYTKYVSGIISASGGGGGGGGD